MPILFRGVFRFATFEKNFSDEKFNFIARPEAALAFCIREKPERAKALALVPP
jgi:hypothetical protein